LWREGFRGLDVFLPYMKVNVKTILEKSMTTQDWKDHLYGCYEKHGGAEKVGALNSVGWNVSGCHSTTFILVDIGPFETWAWPYGEGLKLPVGMNYDLSLAV
jgi:leukotriene-A4 hydrolase